VVCKKKEEKREAWRPRKRPWRVAKAWHCTFRCAVCRSACVTQLVAHRPTASQLHIADPSVLSCCSFPPAKREIRRANEEGNCHLGYSVPQHPSARLCSRLNDRFTVFKSLCTTAALASVFSLLSQHVRRAKL
jgi:hypothetical protein